MNLNKLKCDLERIFNDKKRYVRQLSEHDTVNNVDGVKREAKIQFESVKGYKLYST